MTAFEHKHAKPDRPIHHLISQRWSPYAFSDKPVAKDDLVSILEAARWAASSYNEQPWSYFIATKDEPDEFAKILSCLVDANQAWAKDAPVLMLGATKLTFARNNSPNAAAIHDLGLANATLTLEATHRGLCVHQMIGILPDKAKQLYQVPDDVELKVGLAIGYAAPAEQLPEALRPRDESPRTRRTLSEFVFSGQWNTASELVL